MKGPKQKGIYEYCTFVESVTCMPLTPISFCCLLFFASLYVSPLALSPSTSPRSNVCGIPLSRRSCSYRTVPDRTVRVSSLLSRHLHALLRPQPHFLLLRTTLYPTSRAIPPTAVSPFAQKPMKGALNGYVFWGVKRIAQQVPYFALPFLTGYAVYVWGKNK